MRKGTRMFKTLQSFGNGKAYRSHQANKRTGYFKACTRCSDLAKKGFLQVAGIRKTSNGLQCEYKYKITDKGLLELGIDNNRTRWDRLFG